MTPRCGVKLRDVPDCILIRPTCSHPAKGTMPDGTPACGHHLRSPSARIEHRAA